MTLEHPDVIHQRLASWVANVPQYDHEDESGDGVRLPRRPTTVTHQLTQEQCSAGGPFLSRWAVVPPDWNSLGSQRVVNELPGIRRVHWAATRDRAERGRLWGFQNIWG